MLSRAILCKQAACTPIWNELGEGRHIYVRMWLHPSRSASAENIANAWLSIQTYGETSKGHNFNSKEWIKNLSSQISSFDPFCMPM